MPLFFLFCPPDYACARSGTDETVNCRNNPGKAAVTAVFAGAAPVLYNDIIYFLTFQGISASFVNFQSNFYSKIVVEFSMKKVEVSMRKTNEKNAKKRPRGNQGVAKKPEKGNFSD